MPSHLYANNTPQDLQYPQETRNLVERPQNLIMMASSSPSTHQEIERGSVVSATGNKVVNNNNTSQSSSPTFFEPVAGPSGLQRQGSIVPTQTSLIRIHLT